MSLSLSDQVKIMKAGFRIFRIDLIRKEIREANSPGGWKVHSTYKSKVSMLGAWNQLMQDERNISG